MPDMVFPTGRVAGVADTGPAASSFAAVPEAAVIAGDRFMPRLFSCSEADRIPAGCDGHHPWANLPASLPLWEGGRPLRHPRLVAGHAA